MFFKKTIPILFLMLVITITVALGKPYPPTAESGDYRVTANRQTYVNINKNFTFTLHFFTSNGTFLPNYNGTTCQLMVYEPQGKKIVHKERLKQSNYNHAYENVIYPDNYTITGEYYYVAQCQDNISNKGGIETGIFVATKTGQNQEQIIQTNDIEKYIILTVIILSFTLLAIGFYKPDITFLTLSGFIFLALGIFLAMNGFAGQDNFITQSISLIIIGTGMYVLGRTYIDYFRSIV